jgi:hypothetical protein
MSTTGFAEDWLDFAQAAALGTGHDAMSALGIDPGPHTGMFAAWWGRPEPGSGAPWKLLYALAFECSALMSPVMLRVLCESAPVVRVAGIEAFVARGRSVKLRGVQTANIHAQISELGAVLDHCGIPSAARPAGTVKPWATDKRLEAAGLLKLAGTSPHIRDAGRHLLFSVCQAGLPDPLSAIARTGGTS